MKAGERHCKIDSNDCMITNIDGDLLALRARLRRFEPCEVYRDPVLYALATNHPDTSESSDFLDGGDLALDYKSEFVATTRAAA